MSLLRGLTRAAMLLGVLALAQTAFAQKVVHPDRVYGEGGSREVESKTYSDGSKSTTITVRDKNGTIREFHKRTEDPNAPTIRESETHEFWDANGKRAGGGTAFYDPNGDLSWWQEESYDANEKRDSGELYIRDNEGKWGHFRWSTAQQKWLPVEPKKGEKDEPPKRPRPPEGPGVIEITSGGYMGLAMVFEDDVKRFTTVGFDASYTHALTPDLGVMADVQWTHGTNEGVTFSKLEVMGGLAFRPLVRRSLSIAPHLLAGLSRVTRDFHSQFVTSEPWPTVAVAAGVDLRTRVNDRMDVQGRIDYNPTFRSGEFRHNVRLSAGLWFRF